MSVALLLVPLAIAAAAAHAGLAKRTDESVCTVETRMRDPDLLAAALRETRAAVTADGTALVAEWAGVRARFERDARQIWSAHFTGDLPEGIDEPRAVDIVRAVDAAYGRQVQRAVLARLTERAPAAGLRLESRSVTPELAVRLVFAVERA
jgi:hypothetical protein